jgi:alpha-tubulin suppressor-like RCC1 family protein
VSVYAGSVNGYKDGPATTSKFGLLNGIFNNGEDLLISEDHKIRAVYSVGGTQYVKTINGTTAAGAADTTLQTKTITFAGLDIDSNGSLSYTDQNADSVGTVENGKVNELRRMTAGTLGIGDGSGKSTYGFIKVKAYNEKNEVPKFKRIQFSGTVATALLFAALDTEDSLWVWGNSPDGAFGTGQMNTIGPTKLYAFEKNILDFQITCSTTGVSLISIITKDNKLYSAGDNTYGQLGRNVAASNADNNSASSFKVFKQCRTDSGLVTDAKKLIVSNETGFKNNLYISVSNEVWACGDHANGVLGRGVVTAGTTTFNKVNNLSDVAYLMGVANGNTSSFANQIVFALKNNGELYAWGYNGAANGQCLTNNEAENIVYEPQPCYNYEIKDVVKNAKYIFSNDNLATNNSSVAYLDNLGDLYIGGYSTSTNVPDLTPARIPYFRKFNMRKIAPDVNLVGADAVIHRQNGTVYKIDNFGARKLF